jgi:hypothetical protein
MKIENEYIVHIPFKTLCCNYEFQIGEKLIIYKHPSKNRLYIIHASKCNHNVKRSTFHRCCDIVE